MKPCYFHVGTSNEIFFENLQYQKTGKGTGGGVGGVSMPPTSPTRGLVEGLPFSLLCL